MSERVFQLIPKAQNYAWGKLGSNSKVAELVSNAYSEITIDKQKNYAEVIVLSFFFFFFFFFFFPIFSIVL